MSGGGKTTQTIQKSDPWIGQQEFLRQLFRDAQRQYERGPAPYYPGPTLAPVSPETLQAQEMARAAVPGQQQLGSDATFAARYGLTEAIAPESNPFFLRHVQSTLRPMTQAFTDPGGVLSTIRSDFGAAGQYGSPRHELAAGIAGGRLADAMAAASASMGSEAYKAGLDAQARTLALLPNVTAAQLAPTTTLDAVGAQARSLQQDFINQAIQRYNYEQQAPWTNLANYQNLIQGTYGGTSTGMLQAPGTPPLMAGLGGAALGYSAAKAFPALALTGPQGAAIGALGMLLMSQF